MLHDHPDTSPFSQRGASLIDAEVDMRLIVTERDHKKGLSSNVDAFAPRVRLPVGSKVLFTHLGKLVRATFQTDGFDHPRNEKFVTDDDTLTVVLADLPCGTLIVITQLPIQPSVETTEDIGWLPGLA